MNHSLNKFGALLLFLALVFAHPILGKSVKIKKMNPSLLSTGGSAFALLVGVNKYNSKSNFEDLNYPEDDVQRLAKVLTDNQYIVEVLKGKKATKKNFLNRLNALVDSAKHDDRIFLYFSGHGDIVKDSFSLAFRLPGGKSTYDEYVSVANISNILKKSNALQQVVIIDACYAGTEKARIFPNNIPYHPALTDVNVFNLTSWSNITKEGIYTDYIIKGLRGDADRNSDSIVDAPELAVYVDEKVQNSQNDGEKYRSKFLFAGSGVLKLTLGTRSKFKSGSKKLLFPYRQYLFSDKKEESIFGLYAYLLFTHPPLTKSDSANYLYICQIYHKIISSIMMVEKGTPPTDLSVLYFPITVKHADKKKVEELVKNDDYLNLLNLYDYDRARKLVHKLDNIRGKEGPILVVQNHPISNMSSDSSTRTNTLVLNLSSSIREFIPSLFQTFYNEFMNNPELNRYWLDYTIDFIREKIGSSLIRINPYIDKETLKLFIELFFKK